MRWVDDDNVALFTDLYELTMAASYHARGLEEPATFDLFTRKLPPRRGYLVACGLDQALDYLERLRFTDESLDYLGSLGAFEPSFLERLAEFRFTGDVWAVPEGEVVFEAEPILRVTAPLIEAQIVETYLLNVVGFQTMVASKAARVATACGDRAFVDFSARRDHAADAALLAARAAAIGGATGTSLVVAGEAFGLALSGTMAHSYVMRADDEEEALQAFAEDYGEDAVLLIDTYDTEEGARQAVRIAERLRRDGQPVFRGVRLDSGDLAALAHSVRRILDDGGLPDVQIFASGDLDEDRIAAIVADGAPIDAFGVGTRMGTSADASHVDVVYKLAEDAGHPKLKLSAGKATDPGRKQVHRVVGNGVADHDVLALADEAVEGGRPLLAEVMAGGHRTGPAETLDELRDRTRAAIAALPDRLRALDPEGPPYEVLRSPGLADLAVRLTDHIQRDHHPSTT